MSDWCVRRNYTESGIPKTAIISRGMTVRAAMIYALQHGSDRIELWPREMTPEELRSMALFRHPPTSVLPLNPICVSPEEVRILKSRGYSFECQRLIRFMSGV